jgi:hypothetical protein
MPLQAVFARFAGALFFMFLIPQTHAITPFSSIFSSNQILPYEYEITP